MIDWILNNSTLTIAVYGALVSTVAVIWNIYKERKNKPNVKVEASVGLLTFGAKTSDPMLCIKAVNSGMRPVTLSSVGIRLSSKENINILHDTGLPLELGEGKSHTSWIGLKELKKENCEFAWYRSATDKLYKSKNIKIMLKRYFDPNTKSKKNLSIRSLNK